MYFVLGSIVIFFASFFGYIAKQIQTGAAKAKSVITEEPQAEIGRSIN